MNNIENTLAVNNANPVNMPSMENKPRLVPSEAVCIYTNSWGYRTYAAKLTDGTYQKLAFYIVDEKGHVSDTIFKKKSQLLKKASFDFVYDLAGDFDKADLDAIKAGYMNVAKSLKTINCIEKLPFELVYKGLYQYRNSQKNDIITIDRVDEEEYLCIDTGCFDTLISKNDWGWKPLAVKKALKQLGFLRVNAGRVYDFAKKDKDGSTYRTVSFRLDETLGEEVEA